MMGLRFDMVATERLKLLLRIAFGCWVVLPFFLPLAALRPLRDRTRSWGVEWLFARKDESDIGPCSQWNITGTYRGTWKFSNATNGSSRYPGIRKTNGNCVIELVTTPTKITGVHYVQWKRGTFDSR